MSSSVGKSAGGGGTSTTTLHGRSTDALPSSSPVLVVGATGGVGRRVVQKLLAADRPVRALIRNRIKAQELFGAYTFDRTSQQAQGTAFCPADRSESVVLGLESVQHLAQHCAVV